MIECTQYLDSKCHYQVPTAYLSVIGYISLNSRNINCNVLFCDTVNEFSNIITILLSGSGCTEMETGALQIYSCFKDN